MNQSPHDPSSSLPDAPPALPVSGPRFVVPERSEPLPPIRKRSRRGIAVVLIASLLMSAGTRYWADTERAAAVPNQGESAARTSLSSMNSFALGLLLGGLRGPLVMILWTESESQKSSKNLEGVDTQIEWIRLLQPEFDTVHIFQIWNKAYNISVQMASLANKYSVILDALDYGTQVDKEKPDDINIITAIAQVYGEKLGSSAEKAYYRRRVRTESMPHVDPSAARRSDPGWHRTQLEPMLDSNFMVLPALTAPTPGHTPPATLPAGEEFNTGASLQYLAKYAPFPDGISPVALGYNFYKRAEVLQTTYGQRHAQLSDLVIDSRPALTLKQWLEAEWEQGRRREMEAFGLPVPEERLDMEAVVAGFSYDRAFSDRHAAELAEFAYRRAANLLADVLAEYERHLVHYTSNAATYRSHMEEAACEGELCAADADYLQAGLVDASARPPLLASAKQHYLRSIYDYQIIILRYYTDPVLMVGALPPGFDRIGSATTKGVDQLPPQFLPQVMARIARNRALRGGRDSHDEDIGEFQKYIDRAALRLSHLQSN